MSKQINLTSLFKPTHANAHIIHIEFTHVCKNNIYIYIYMYMCVYIKD